MRMLVIVLTLLGGIHGLHLRTDPESDIENAQLSNMTYMSVGRNERLQALKKQNDMLDTYILNHSQMTPVRRRRHEISMSLEESDGFFDEPEEQWIMRRKRHKNQMAMQSDLMTICPANVFEHARQCLVGCVGEPADCPPNIFWQTHYEPSFSCTFEERIGVQGEGGKWVCDPYKIQGKKDCLIYSVGSHGQYDFEESVHKHISSNCEIHTFDMNHWADYTNHPPPEYVTYHVKTIGPEPNTPIGSLVRELGHTGREIDIFKIDCEGCEWETYRSWFAENIHIRQVLVEIHGTHGGRGAHDFFNFLFDQGYVVFHKEPNILGPVIIPGPSPIEYAFVRLSSAFSRINVGTTNATVSS